MVGVQGIGSINTAPDLDAAANLACINDAVGDGPLGRVGNAGSSLLKLPLFSMVTLIRVALSSTELVGICSGLLADDMCQCVLGSL